MNLIAVMLDFAQLISLLKLDLDRLGQYLLAGQHHRMLYSDVQIA